MLARAERRINQILVGVRSDQIEKLTTISDKEKRSRSELIRDALDYWFGTFYDDNRLRSPRDRTPGSLE